MKQQIKQAMPIYFAAPYQLLMGSKHGCSVEVRSTGKIYISVTDLPSKQITDRAPSVAQEKQIPKDILSVAMAGAN